MADDNSPTRPALATQKRKFYQLLDDLTSNKSLVSLASSHASSISLADPSALDTPLKRIRASMEQRRTVSGERVKALQEKLFTPSRANTRLIGAGLRAVGSATAATPSDTPRKPPNFAPYRQDQFLERLETFADVKKWSNKPDEVGEVEWAKRGWSCDIWNTVACKGGCESRVLIQLRPKRKDASGNEIEMSEDLAEDIEEGLVENYQDQIINGHDECCPWRKMGCRDEIYQIEILKRDTASEELLKRYHSFKPINADLPLLEHMNYPGPVVSNLVGRISSKVWEVLSLSNPEPIPTTPTEIAAFAFAVFGWSGSKDFNTTLAVCNHCFQRVGLWLYNETRIKEMSEKLHVPIESLRLNLLESHHEHCPWKNPDTQRNSKDGPIENMAAWETLEFVIIDKRRDRELARKAAEANIDESGEFRDSFESEDILDPASKNSTKSLNEKWKILKAKLKRTTSRKSLKSSSKSVRSTKSTGEKNKETDKAAMA
ncbi:zf-C3HC-domain-containing protein [Polyplosphaeria fusca]|uniref:Zf-C3HC-domain-containing protein n=1 Tax=Polyplosphaeria fusca TaxID=682080 RepID=A0A9P4R7V5_9PLEO|nr:zf-C3HC-domain-containing protein [Polyplosphaeria fusca]